MILATVPITIATDGSQLLNSTKRIHQSAVVTYDDGKLTINEMSRLVRVMNEKQNYILLPTMIYLGFVGIFGTLGNILVLYVFQFKRKQKTSASFFILFLAWVDVIVCCFDVPLQIHLFINYFQTPPCEWFVCKFSRWMIYSMVSVMCMALAVIAYDRYKAICKPLTWRTETSKKLKTIMVVILLVGVIGQLSQFLFGRDLVVPLKQFMSLNTLDSKGFNTSVISIDRFVCACGYLYEYQDTLYFWFILANLLIFSSCIVLSTIFYTKICKEMRRRNRFWRFNDLSARTGSKYSIEDNLASGFLRQMPSKNIGIHTRKYTIEPRGKDTESGVSCTSFSRNCDPDYPLPHRKNAIYMDPQKLEEVANMNESYPSSRKNSIDCIVSADVTAGARKQFKSVMEGDRPTAVTSKEQRSESVGSISILSTDSRRNSRTPCLNQMLRRASESTVIFRQNFVISKVFLSVTTMLFLTWSPYWILKIFSIVVSDVFVDHSDIAMSLIYFMDNLYYINNAINPVVYMILNKRFRRDVKDLFCRKEKGPVLDSSEMKMANIL